MKSILYIFSLFVIGWLTTYSHFTEVAFNGDKVLQDLTAQLTEPKDIGIIGDSVIDSWNPRRDFTPDGIAIKLAKLLDKPVLNMAYPGLRLEDYSKLIKVCLNEAKSIQLIVAEINPVLLEWKEAFGVREFFHQQLTCWQNPDINWYHLLLYAALKEFRFSGRPAWESSSANKPNAIDKGLIHYTAHQLNMAHPLDEVRLKNSLLGLKEFAQEHDLKIIFFITPVDLKTLKTCAGGLVYDSLINRIQTINDICTQHQLQYLDLHDLIKDSERFFDPHRVHLDEYARQQVATALAEMCLNAIHGT